MRCVLCIPFLYKDSYLICSSSSSTTRSSMWPRSSVMPGSASSKAWGNVSRKQRPLYHERRTNEASKKKGATPGFFPARLFRTPSPSSSPTEFSYNFLPRICCFRRIDLRPHSVTIDDILFFLLFLTSKSPHSIHRPMLWLLVYTMYIQTRMGYYKSLRASRLRPLRDFGRRDRTGVRPPCTRWRRRA